MPLPQMRGQQRLQPRPVAISQVMPLQPVIHRTIKSGNSPPRSTGHTLALYAWINSLQGVAALLAIGGLVASIFVLGWLDRIFTDIKEAKRRRLSKVSH
jgi:hypothetical protein